MAGQGHPKTIEKVQSFVVYKFGNAKFPTLSPSQKPLAATINNTMNKMIKILTLIFDSNGSEVYKNMLQSNSSISELHLSTLNSGIYIITFEPIIPPFGYLNYQSEQFKIIKY